MPRDWYLCLRNVAHHLVKGLDIQGLGHPDYMTQAWPIQDLGLAFFMSKLLSIFRWPTNALQGYQGRF